jgi:hypothetical protein
MSTVAVARRTRDGRIADMVFGVGALVDDDLLLIQRAQLVADDPGAVAARGAGRGGTIMRSGRAGQGLSAAEAAMAGASGSTHAVATAVRLTIRPTRGTLHME